MKTMKNMPMKLIGALALVLMVAFNSCKEDEGVITPQFPELKEVTCKVDDELDITFNANLDWSIQSSAAWCKFVNGEFAETTASGKAGEQSLKIKVSDESWNYQTEDVAELTLKMMDATQVIYKITRGKKEYQDLVVVDSEGNKVGESFIIKGNTGSVTYSSLKASAEKGVKVGVKYPEWLIMTYNSASGYYDFTFNTDKETNGGLDFREPYDDGQSFITFVTEDAETAETDKIRKVMIPVSYEGFDKETVLIEPRYMNITVSYDGKITVDGQELTELTSEITAFKNDFEVVVGEQKKRIISENEFIYEYDFNSNVDWLHQTKNNSTIKITFEQNIPDDEEGNVGETSIFNGINNATNSGPRSAIVLALPKVIYDEISSDRNSHLLDENKDLKSNYSSYIVTSLEQEAKKSIKFNISYLELGDLYDIDGAGLGTPVTSEIITGDELDEIKKVYSDIEDDNIAKIIVTDELKQYEANIIINITGVDDLNKISVESELANFDRQIKDIDTEEVIDVVGVSITPAQYATAKTYDVLVKDSDNKNIAFCRIVIP